MIPDLIWQSLGSCPRDAVKSYSTARSLAPHQWLLTAPPVPAKPFPPSPSPPTPPTPTKPASNHGPQSPPSSPPSQKTGLTTTPPSPFPATPLHKTATKPPPALPRVVVSAIYIRAGREIIRTGNLRVCRVCRWGISLQERG